MLHHQLSSKTSSIADTINSLAEALISKVPFEHRVTVTRHVHQSRPLLEFRVVRPNDKETQDYGVRQAWIYTYPEKNTFEMHFTHREDILRILEEYPDFKNVPSIAYATAKKTPEHDLAELYQAVEVLVSFLTDRLDEVPAGSPEVEAIHKENISRDV